MSPALEAAGLFHEGRLEEAIASLNAEVRKAPTDVQRRTFLFELLCFAGSYDRAQKQLSALAKLSPDAAASIMSYDRVVAEEEARQGLFASGSVPEAKGARPVRGELNGEPFEMLEDGDPRIGARLEMFVAGQYRLMPLEHLATVSMPPPAKARDLLWVTASVVAGEALEGADMGEVLVPALTPLAHTHEDQLVRLGRVTEWQEDGETDVPIGQKMLLVDGEDFPILEVRELVISGPAEGVG